ncbi:MAG: biotin--[acetyl-CoA-carboxylase] ligase [Acidobacteriota bacterium]
MDVRDYTSVLCAGAGGGLENVVVVQRTDSTNLLARRIASEFAADESELPRSLLVALEQTSGRGRLGRTWDSPAGLGIYATVLVQVPVARLSLLPLAVPAALASVLQKRLRRRVRIKWPNDLQIEGRKLGGVLIEGSVRGGGPALALVGFGVNYGHRAEQLPTAFSTSIALESDEAPPMPEIASQLAAAVVEACVAADEAEVLARYTAFSVHHPGDTLVFKLGDELVEGIFAGFESGGRLRLRGTGGERLISAAEVVEK